MVATKITIPKGLNEFIDYINNSFIQSNELYDDIRFDYAIGNTELQKVISERETKNEAL